MESIFELKKDAVMRHIPIILDDTLETITRTLKERENNGIYVNKILEIGTAIGYSSICFADLLNSYGRIDTIERDPEMIKEAKENIKFINESNSYAGKTINLIEGDASELLPTMSEKYDMIFIDANKSKYPVYLKEGLRLLNPNGIIFADNILYKGYVMSDYNEHKQRTAVRHLREFIKMATEDTSLNTEILEIGDGLAIISLK